jgi:hypothetical protein
MMTFEQRAIQIVREFTFAHEDLEMTEKQVNDLRARITKGFEEQHHASMHQLSVFLAERFKENFINQKY